MSNITDLSMYRKERDRWDSQEFCCATKNFMVTVEQVDDEFLAVIVLKPDIRIAAEISDEPADALRQAVTKCRRIRRFLPELRI